MEVKDKVIVVTGGASGIGKSLCERFAMDGAHAVVAADIDTAGLGSTLSSIENNTNGLGLQCDVANEDAVKNLVSVTLREFGRIDLFCSNAGIFTAGGEEVSNDRWKNIWDINVMSHIFAARAVLPSMLERGGVLVEYFFGRRFVKSGRICTLLSYKTRRDRFCRMVVNYLW